jgi:hypothetical protein
LFSDSERQNAINLRLASTSDSFYSRLLSEFDRRISFPLALTFYPSAGACQGHTNYRASILKQLDYTLSRFELKLAPGCKGHKTAEAISSSRPNVARLYDASAQLAQVVVDDRDQDLAHYLIEIGLRIKDAVDQRPNHERGLSATTTVEPRCSWYSRTAIFVRPCRRCKRTILTEGDYQPMKIGCQKLDESHATLVPIVK